MPGAFHQLPEVLDCVWCELAALAWGPALPCLV